MKKSKIVLALMSVVIVLSLAVVQPLAIDPPDFSNIYTQHIDLSSLTVLSGVPTIQDENQWFVSDLRTVFGLGSVDFTNYSKITISYASPADALFGDDGSFWALLKSAEFTDYSDEENVIAKGSLSNAQSAWFDDIRSSTIDVSGIDYVGEAFLAFYLPRSTLRFMSMDITYKAYLQSEVNDIIKEYISPANGLFTDCKVYANVSYTLSIADVDGGAYKDYNRTWYYDAPFKVLSNGISLKPWYQVMKNEIFENLTNADDGYINDITFYVHLNKPTNSDAMSIFATTTAGYNIDTSVNFQNTDYDLLSTVPDVQSFYTGFVVKTYPGMPENFQITEIQIHLSAKDKANFDDLFLMAEFMVGFDSVFFEGYAEAYNSGLAAGKEIQLREQRLEVKKAYDKGLKEGNQAGYQQASREKDAEYTKIINEIRDDIAALNQENYDEGYDLGSKNGYALGYNDGVTQNPTTVTDNVGNLIMRTFDNISIFIENFLNFDLLGINLLGFFTAVLSIFVFFFFLKWLMKVLGKL